MCVYVCLSIHECMHSVFETFVPFIWIYCNINVCVRLSICTVCLTMRACVHDTMHHSYGTDGNVICRENLLSMHAYVYLTRSWHSSGASGTLICECVCVCIMELQHAYICNMCLGMCTCMHMVYMLYISGCVQTYTAKPGAKSRIQSSRTFVIGYWSNSDSDSDSDSDLISHLQRQKLCLKRLWSFRQSFLTFELSDCARG